MTHAPRRILQGRAQTHVKLCAVGCGPLQEVVCSSAVSSRGFDADPVADGVQAVSFRFVGTDKSFVANDRSVAELRFDSRTHTLHGDCNNDGALDFQIMMLGVSSLSATDFLL